MWILVVVTMMWPKYSSEGFAAVNVTQIPDFKSKAACERAKNTIKLPQTERVNWETTFSCVQTSLLENP